MPRVIKTVDAKPLPREKAIIFPQDQEALKTNPNHDPCIIWIRGELTERQHEYIGIATGELKEVDQNGTKKVQATSNPFKLPGAILDIIFDDPMTRWNIETEEGDEIAVTRENWEKHVPKRDRMGWSDGPDEDQQHPGLRMLFMEYYSEQLTDMSTVEPTEEQLNSDDPTSESVPAETPEGAGDSLSLPEAQSELTSPSTTGSPDSF